MKIFLFAICLSYLSAQGADSTNIRTNKIFKKPLKEFLERFGEVKKQEKYPFVLIDINSKQSQAVIYCVNAQEFLDNVIGEDSKLYIDGGFVEGRKIILCYEIKPNLVTNIPLSCAHLVKDIDNELYQDFLFMAATEGTREYRLRFEGVASTGKSGAALYLILDKRGHIKKKVFDDFRDTKTYKSLQKFLIGHGGETIELL